MISSIKKTTKALTEAALELCDLRANIKAMQTKEREIGDMFRDIIKVGGTKQLDGLHVTIVEGTRTMIDRDKLEEALGVKEVKKYEKQTIYTSVKILKETK